jgi:hypothetical protein
MAKITFTIPVRDNEINETFALDWTGYTTATPGLVVHKAAVRKFDPEAIEVLYVPGDTWAVAHRESGLAIPQCSDLPTRRAAIMLANSLGDYEDWTRSAEELRKKNGATLRVRLRLRNNALERDYVEYLAGKKR